VKYLTQQLDKWVLRCEASEARVREHESTIAEGASEGRRKRGGTVNKYKH
jgi:hypothetical protein